MDDTTVTERSASSAAEPTRAERIELTQGGIDVAQAGSIILSEGGIRTATADTIDIQQGGIVRATASDIAVTNGGIVLAQGDTTSVDRGLVVAAIGGQTRLVQSAANMVAARDAVIDQSLVTTVMGAQVTIRQPSAIGVLLAGKVEGSVRPLLDWRGALAFGAAFAVVARILRR